MRDFYVYTQEWIRGELLEAKWILLLSLSVCAVSLLLYLKLHTSQRFTALLIAACVVGVFFTLVGASMWYSNVQRLSTFPLLYQENPAAFVASEQLRVMAFVKWYPITRYIAMALGALGLLLMLTQTLLWQTIGATFLLFMLSTFVIDGVSSARAHRYQLHIEHYLSISPTQQEEKI